MHPYRFVFRIYDVLRDISAMVALFALTIVRTCYATTWHSLQTMNIAAFKVVRQLKREYAESYDTHGLSLYHRIGT
jgi:hypothetical protein